jgi:hypothetical protein
MAPPQRTAERQKLAEAIEQHARAVQRLEHVREAWSRLRLNEAGADREKAQAERALADARERAPRLMVAQLLGGQTEAAVSVEDAAAALAAATQAVEDAAQARTLLLEEERAAEQAIEWASGRRRDAINEVLRMSQEVGQLCARIEATRQLLHDLTWALSAVGLTRLPQGFHWDGTLWGPRQRLGGAVAGGNQGARGRC